MGRTVEEVAPGCTHLLMGLEAVLSLKANFKNSALNSVREMGKVQSECNVGMQVGGLSFY